MSRAHWVWLLFAGTVSRAHWVWLLFAGTVSRADWVTRNSETYGQNRLVAHVLFDYLDSNNDNNNIIIK